jgi:hypothetical protein
MVNVNPDPAAAFQEAARFLEAYYGVDFGSAYLEVWVVSGPAETVAARIRADLQAGCTVPILRFASWQQDVQFDRFATEVMPRLRDVVVAADAA